MSRDAKAHRHAFAAGWIKARGDGSTARCRSCNHCETGQLLRVTNTEKKDSRRGATTPRREAPGVGSSRNRLCALAALREILFGHLHRLRGGSTRRLTLATGTPGAEEDP